jgi:lipase
VRVTREAQGRVPGDGVELAFGHWPGSAAPVVCLHGLTASYMTFVGIAERLAGRRAVFALDLRGRGDSDKPEGPYGMSQHARDVAAAIDAMKLGPSIVAGHSMGAFVAAALAAQHPHLVAGLVLIDGGFAPALETANPALELRISQLEQEYCSRQAYREFWRNQPHFPPADWGPWIERVLDYEVGGEPPHLRPKAASHAVRADLAEGFQTGFQTAQLAARLRAIRAPVLMIRAETGFTPSQPPLYPESLLGDMRSLLPDMQERFIPGTTHYTLMIGNHGATAVADLIADFAQSALMG